MRIISGRCGGRMINPPKNLRARPTTDFAKENLFTTADAGDAYVYSLTAEEVEDKDYNNAVKEYNSLIIKFPNNMLAGMFGFEKTVYFECDDDFKVLDKYNENDKIKKSKSYF